MTLPAFQSALAELLAGGESRADQAQALTDVERRRLEAVASQPGLSVMRTLSFSWRLTKVLSLLPLTSALLGDEALAHHLTRFCQHNKATSLYFVDECLAFLSYLEERLSDVPVHAADVFGFERARLHLQSELARGRVPPPQRVRFRCDPAALFAALNAHADVTEVPGGDVILQGEMSRDGRESWSPIAHGRPGSAGVG